MIASGVQNGAHIPPKSSEAQLRVWYYSILLQTLAADVRAAESWAMWKRTAGGLFFGGVVRINSVLDFCLSRDSGRHDSISRNLAATAVHMEGGAAGVKTSTAIVPMY